VKLVGLKRILDLRKQIQTPSKPLYDSSFTKFIKRHYMWFPFVSALGGKLLPVDSLRTAM